MKHGICSGVLLVLVKIKIYEYVAKNVCEVGKALPIKYHDNSWKHLNNLRRAKLKFMSFTCGEK